MTDHATLPLEAHHNKSVFLEHAWNIGRAYRNQALELISICQLLSRVASTKFAHEDAELRSIFRMCDIALRSAADSGMNVTSEANARFKEVTQVLNTFSSSYSECVHRLDVPLTVSARMETAIKKDSVECVWSHKSEAEWGPTMTINFVLLQSPLLSPHDPETIIVSRAQCRSILARDSLELQPLQGPCTYHPRAEPSLLSALPCR
ncbi:hypothetical protein EDB83DRAFT_669199 [Lactarius deliciosus]|nr:hypothetical protein EDB83DRAFT_669199 [Lactarius deliciosus]